MTVEQLDRLVEARAGFCEICQKRPATDIDHDHTSLNVRGLLCGQCNRGIGCFSDSTEVLAQAITYLQRDPLPYKLAPRTRSGCARQVETTRNVPDRDTFINEYFELGRSLEDMAKKYGVNKMTLSRAAKRYGVQLRPAGRRKKVS
jgi:hypothetical protein